MPPKQASSPFAVDERVFCFHMDMLYEARVLDVKHATVPGSDGGPSEKQWQFRIHYKGWKNTWDDWVPQDRVRKFNDENRELAAQLREQAHLLQQQKSAKAAKKTLQGGVSGSGGGSGGPPGPPGLFSSGGGSGGGGRSSLSAAAAGVVGGGHGGGSGAGTGTGTPGDRGHHAHHHDRYSHHGRGDSEMTSARGSEERTAASGVTHTRGPRRQQQQHQQRDYELENEDAFHNRPSIRLMMPDHIKAALVDDWENITKNNLLVPLPHPFPVDKVLEDYLAYERPRREEGSASMDILEETIAGLREYFNRCLGRVLLYRFERLQYLEMHKLWDTSDEYHSAMDTYGAEHLCRLLVSLPELISQTNMDQQSVNRLRDELSKLTVWLGRHMGEYFVSQYETPSEQADRRILNFPMAMQDADSGISTDNTQFGSDNDTLADETDTEMGESTVVDEPTGSTTEEDGPTGSTTEEYETTGSTTELDESTASTTDDDEFYIWP